jgi:glucoamylase
MYRTSLTVMKIHGDKEFSGGFIASLSIPWGTSKGDDDLGGYHLIWPRDLVETAGGLLAAGATEEVKEILDYLAATQLGDGHWSQNMWLNGTPYWDGVQMDETAFPILLVDLAVREKILNEKKFRPMVLKAAGYLVKNGPVTQQDRWEEDPGYSPFTLAVEIAALLAAAESADLDQSPKIAKYLRETADAWNANIECWTYVTGTELAKKAGVDGYYVRIAPPEQADASSPKDGFVPIKNRPVEQSVFPAQHIISPDALALVRFGLRSAHDPKIINTVKVVDYFLKTQTPSGSGWHRYNGDGYGEHEDGSPFDGTGTGRIWPLLTGERGHYELAAGNPKEARNFLNTLANFSNEGGMIPEQVWDSADIQEKELFFGKPSGSAMPLVWAHAEYAKLLRSVHDEKVFDMPAQTYKRYVQNKNVSSLTLWRFNHKCRLLPQGKILRIETLSPALIHWSSDEWKTAKDTKTEDTGLGIFFADLDTTLLEFGRKIIFTFYWLNDNKWEGSDFEVEVVSSTEKTFKQAKLKLKTVAPVEIFP